MSQKESSSKRGSGREQPFLTKEHRRRGFGEVAGGTAADFAAVCCCPCVLLPLAILALVKLPAGLCKKTVKKIKRKIGAKKRSHGKTANDKVQTLWEEASVDSSRDDMLCSDDEHDMVNVQIVFSRISTEQNSCRISTEQCWEEVTGKSYIGFWRNYSVKE